MATVALLVAAAGLLIISRRRQPKPLNVVLICLDTVRYDTFFLPESRSVPDALSPWLSRGVVFRDVQSTAPWTVPAVASVMTGLYPTQHGAGKFRNRVATLAVDVPAPMAAGVRTIAEELSSRGFRTRALYANPFIDPAQGILAGFDRIKAVPTEKIPASAADWLRSRAPRAGGFLLYLHLMDAHDAHGRPVPALRSSNAGLAPAVRQTALASAPAGICAADDDEMCLRYVSYVGAVRRDRAAVATVLESLRSERLLEETIVILFSDHGEEFNDHLEEERALATDPRGYPGFGHGHSLYQELLHVPLVVWHPQSRGGAVEAPVSLVDLAPTLSDWLGISWKVAAWPGRSFAALQGIDADETLRRRARFSTGIAYGAEQFAAVRDGEKVIVQESAGRRFAFDLLTDPGEKRPQPVTTQRRLFAEATALAALPPVGKARSESMTEERRGLLRSIGYLISDRRASTGADKAVRRGISAEPNPIVVCDGSGLGLTTIKWSSPPGKISIRLESRTGPLFAQFDGTGSVKTGKWVKDGLKFVAVDATERQVGEVTVHLTAKGCW